jgi:hypothetical protein
MAAVLADIVTVIRSRPEGSSLKASPTLGETAVWVLGNDPDGRSLAGGASATLPQLTEWVRSRKWGGALLP